MPTLLATQVSFFSYLQMKDDEETGKEEFFPAPMNQPDSTMETPEGK